MLRHELAILRRQTSRPAMTTIDQLFLAAASRLLPRMRWRSFVITPRTLLRWHRRLVEKRWKLLAHVGRPVIRREVRELVMRLARETRGGDISALSASLRAWRRGVSDHRAQMAAGLCACRHGVVAMTSPSSL